MILTDDRRDVLLEFIERLKNMYIVSEYDWFERRNKVIEAQPVLGMVNATIAPRAAVYSCAVCLVSEGLAGWFKWDYVRLFLEAFELLEAELLVTRSNRTGLLGVVLSLTVRDAEGMYRYVIAPIWPPVSKLRVVGKKEEVDNE